jgi:drug/metabolite transporter (DMT)-like permease
VAAAARVSPGVRDMAVSAFWFSVMSLGVKAAGRRLPSQEVVLVRGVITLALSWAVLRRAGLGVRGAGRVRQAELLLRGALGTAGLTCFYASLVRLPLAEATLLQYTNPLWAAALAAAALGERVRARDALALGAGLAGVAMVVGPGLAGARAGVGAGPAAVGLLGALCSAAAYVVIRRMSGGDGRPPEDPRRVTLYLPLVTVPATLPAALPAWVWPTAGEWLVLAGVGASTQLAQTYMTRGLQRERAARATAVGYLQLVFAALWGWLVFGDRPAAWTAAGAATIVAGTLALAFGRAAPGAGARAPSPPPAAAASAAETAEAL